MRVPGVPFVQGRNDYRDADGKKYGIAIHNTSNDASDEGEASYARRRTDGVSSHFYVDGDSVTQSLDTRDCAGHAGSAAGNGNAIAVEITGGNGKSRDWWLRNVAWSKLGAVLAAVCRHHGIPVRRVTPAQMRANSRVGGFYGHDDMRRAWGGTDHTDPGPNFPWDRLLEAVTEALDGEDDDVKLTDTLTLAQVPGVTYSGKTTTVGGALTSILAYVLQSRNLAKAAADAEAARDQVQDAKLELLAATVKGSAAEVKAKQDALAAAETARADAEAKRDEADRVRDEAILAAITGGGSTRPEPGQG